MQAFYSYFMKFYLALNSNKFLYKTYKISMTQKGKLILQNRLKNPPQPLKVEIQ